MITLQNFNKGLSDQKGSSTQLLYVLGPLGGPGDINDKREFSVTLSARFSFEYYICVVMFIFDALQMGSTHCLAMLARHTP